jgi:hypothetical protein
VHACMNAVNLENTLLGSDVKGRVGGRKGARMKVKRRVENGDELILWPHGT